MKKTAFLSLLFCCMLFGCTKGVTITISDVQTITYQNKNSQIDTSAMAILEEDYSDISDSIERLSFSKIKDRDYASDRILVVTTKEDIYRFILDGNEIYYQVKDQLYVAEDASFLKFISTLEQEYTRFDFFQFQYEANYQMKETDVNVKLDNVKDYFLLDFKEEVSHFTIHEVRYQQEDLNEISLLYQEDEVKPSRVVIRKNCEKLPSFKVSFETKYHYIVTIIPYWDSSHEMQVSITYQQK